MPFFKGDNNYNYNYVLMPHLGRYAKLSYIKICLLLLNSLSTYI
jgi:hypothetical protein